MQQWFYLTRFKERLPFDEGDVPSLVLGGVIRPETMVWREGFEDGWISSGETRPEWFREMKTAPAADGGASAEVAETVMVKGLAGQLIRGGGWIRTVAWALIVPGVLWILACGYLGWRREWLDLTTLLVAVPLAALGIGAGFALLKGVRLVGHAGNAGQLSQLSEGLRGFRTAAFLLGLGFLISLALAVVFAVVAMVLWSTGGGPLAG